MSSFDKTSQKPIGTTMYLTLNQAAKVSKRAKATLLAAISNGRLTAKKNDIGQWEIEASELHRVFPFMVLLEPRENHDQLNETTVMTAEISGLKGRLEVMERLLAQVEGERDNLRGQVASLTALLPAPQKAEDNPPASEGHNVQNAPTGRKTGFWGFLFGRAA